MRRLMAATATAALLLAAGHSHTAAVPSPVHVVAGRGVGSTGTLTLQAAVVDSAPERATGYVVWEASGAPRVDITVDCGFVTSHLPGAYGISHRLHASGRSADGSRYYVRVNIDGDAGPHSAAIGVRPDPEYPCDALPRDVWVYGIFEITP